MMQLIRGFGPFNQSSLAHRIVPFDNINNGAGFSIRRFSTPVLLFEKTLRLLAIAAPTLHQIS